MKLNPASTLSDRLTLMFSDTVCTRVMLGASNICVVGSFFREYSLSASKIQLNNLVEFAVITRSMEINYKLLVEDRGHRYESEPPA